MSANIPVTPGTGATVGTHLIGGVHYPLGKMVFGNSSTATVVEEATPLPVSNDRIVTVVSSATLNAVATQFNSGDVIQSFTFSNVVAANGGRGVIEAATLTQTANQSSKLNGLLLLFQAAPTATENSAFAPTTTNMNECVGRVFFQAGRAIPINMAAGASGRVINDGLFNRPVPHFVCGGASTSLFGVLVDYTDPLSSATLGYLPIASEVLRIELHVRRL